MKMNYYTMKYINDYVLDRDDKRLLLDCFRVGKNVKQKEMRNYLTVFEYERSRKVYDTDRPELLEEVRYIPVGTIDFWNMLSVECQKFINFRFEERYNIESSEIHIFYHDYSKSAECSAYQRIIDRLQSFAIRNDLDCVDNEGDIIDSRCIEQAIETNRIINEDLVKLEIIVYALQEFDLSLIDFDSDDNLILTEKAIKLYIVERHVVPLTLQERMRKSISASYQLFKGYAQCNADRFKYFVTLTFAEKEEKEKHLKLNAERRDCDINLKFKYVLDPQDYDECVKVMTSFLNKMKKYFQRKKYEFYYLGVPEYQGNGNIHYHFLMSEIPNQYLYAVPDWLDRDYNTNKKLRGTGCTLWEYGKSDVSLIDYRNKVSTYISKYMLKSLSNISSSQYLFRLNKKRFYKSNNLDKPIIKYDYFNENDIEFVSYYFNENLDQFDGTMIRTRTYQLREI